MPHCSRADQRAAPAASQRNKTDLRDAIRAVVVGGAALVQTMPMNLHSAGIVSEKNEAPGSRETLTDGRRVRHQVRHIDDDAVLDIRFDRRTRVHACRGASRRESNRGVRK